MQDLHKVGVRSVMLAGDNPTTARAIASKVGIHDVRDNLLPKEKLVAVEKLVVRYGSVGTVRRRHQPRAGAPPRPSAGFAMGAAATDTAIESADVAFMDDDLRKLARHPVAIPRASCGRKLPSRGLASTLWMAVFADMGTSLIVVFKGLRLLKAEDDRPIHPRPKDARRVDRLFPTFRLRVPSVALEGDELHEAAAKVSDGAVNHHEYE